MMILSSQAAHTGGTLRKRLKHIIYISFGYLTLILCSSNVLAEADNTQLEYIDTKQTILLAERKARPGSGAHRRDKASLDASNVETQIKAKTAHTIKARPGSRARSRNKYSNDADKVVSGITTKEHAKTKTPVKVTESTTRKARPGRARKSNTQTVEHMAQK